VPLVPLNSPLNLSKPVPGRVGLRVFLLSAILISVGFDVPSSRAAGPEVLTIRDSGNLRIDGRLDDWPVAGRWELDSKNQVLDGRPYWQGPGSLSAKIYFSYDEDNLYMAAVVRQAHLASGVAQETVRPEGDGLELTVSSGWDEGRSMGWTRRDVPLLLAPGNKAHDPVVWNQARQEVATGARLVAKTTNQGYLMEAALPWSLFPGIHVAPGKQVRFRVSLHSGDAFSGGMVFRIQSGGDQPGDWPFFRFGGNAVLDTPMSYGQDQNDPEAARLDEGVKGSLPKETGIVEGVVVDASGRPRKGASISLWPVSPGGRTGEDGTFRFESSHLYDRTLVRAASEGLGSVLVPYRSGKPMTLRLPERETPVWGFGFVGSDPARTFGDLALEWPPSTSGEVPAYFDRAVTTGHEPILCLALDPSYPEGASREARGIQKTSGQTARYWALLPPGKPIQKYDALNAYRRAYLALKTAVPDSWVLAPGLAAGDVESWEAFSNAEGDALDMALVKGDFRMGTPWDTASEGKSLSKVFRFLKDAPRGVLSRLENPVPVALWLQAGGRTEVHSVLPALWLASVYAAWSVEPQGPLLIDWEGGVPTADSPEGRMASMLGEVVGAPLDAESYQPGIRVCARRSKEGTIHLLAVNENDRESTVVKVSLKKRKTGVVVDAELNDRLEFVIPAQSAVVIRILPKTKPTGRSYGYHDVLKGQEPQALQIN